MFNRSRKLNLGFVPAQMVLLLLILLIALLSGGDEAEARGRGRRWNATSSRGRIDDLDYEECGQFVWPDDLARDELRSGRQRSKNRFLVFGFPARFGQFPSAVLVETSYDETSLAECGGTLIDYDTVITAAHCIVPYSGPLRVIGEQVSIWVHAGRLRNRFEDDDEAEFAQSSAVSSYCLASDFHKPEADPRRPVDSDYAILKLANPFDKTRYVSPACIEFNDDFVEAAESVGEIYGVGYGLQGHSDDGIYKRLKYHAMHGEYCELPQPDIAACYRTVQHGRLCSGDSGSGLYKILNGRQYLIGVAIKTTFRRRADGTNNCSEDDFTQAVYFDAVNQEARVKNLLDSCEANSD